MFRKHMLGVGLAAGLLLTGGGVAAADVTPAPTVPPSAPVTCVRVEPPQASPATGTVRVLPKQVPCLVKRSDLLPKGAPQTGGGGMAAEVESWG